MQKFFERTRLNQKCADSTPDVCNASLFDRLLRYVMNESACSSMFVHCLLALIASFPCPHRVSIGLSSGARLGNHSNRIPI